MITVEDLHKSFDGLAVLRGASFRVEKKELLALIGKSGHGKSVLLKHVAGLMQPDRGRIVIDGSDICCLKRKDLFRFRSRIGFLFQGGALFDSMSVFDNVAFPLREKTTLSERQIRDTVFSELEQVGLTGSEKRFPAEISGGMLKRAALARSMVTEPEMMFFDEPTTGLDPITADTILNLILSCHKRLGFTGIIVTHQIPKVFGIVDKVAMIHDGRILTVTTPQEIGSLKDPIVQKFIHGSVVGQIGQNRIDTWHTQERGS